MLFKREVKKTISEDFEDFKNIGKNVIQEVSIPNSQFFSKGTHFVDYEIKFQDQAMYYFMKDASILMDDISGGIGRIEVVSDSHKTSDGIWIHYKGRMSNGSGLRFSVGLKKLNEKGFRIFVNTNGDKLSVKIRKKYLTISDITDNFKDEFEREDVVTANENFNDFSKKKIGAFEDFR